MKEKKNIDRLYQEKFKDFEVPPREAVWENIAEKLKEKEEKRPFIIPLWYKLAGVAALMAVILGIGFGLTHDSSSESQVVFEIPETAKPVIKDPTTNSILPETSRNLRDLIDHEEDFNKSETNKKNSGTNNAAAVAQDTRKYSPKNEQENNETSFAQNSSQIKEGIQTIKSQKKQKPILQNTQVGIAETKPEEISKIQQSKNDSLSNPSNSLAEVEKELSKDDKEDLDVSGKAGKLSLSTFAAPVYYDNMGSGNALASEFANYNSEGEVSMAYGIKVAYSISDKVKIRSGISKVDMSYNTRDVAYEITPSSQSIASINYDSGGENIQLKGAPTSTENTALPNNSFMIMAPRNEKGTLNQQFGFIEVPLEIELSLIDKKFGLNLIGGGSGLILNNNSIYLDGASQNTKLGSANNINSFSFSTNLGVGLDYDLSEKFQLNLEPTFKYQINTFRDTQNVQPYFLGVYTGFSYKF